MVVVKPFSVAGLKYNRLIETKPAGVFYHTGFFTALLNSNSSKVIKNPLSLTQMLEGQGASNGVLFNIAGLSKGKQPKESLQAGIYCRFNRLKALFRASFPSEIKTLSSYDKSVKISQEFDGDVFNRINSMKSTIGNFAKSNKVKVKFEPADTLDKVKMTVTKKDFEATYYDSLPLGIFDDPSLRLPVMTPIEAKIAEKVLSINPSNVEDSFAKNIFKELSNAVSQAF